MGNHGRQHSTNAVDPKTGIKLMYIVYSISIVSKHFLADGAFLRIVPDFHTRLQTVHLFHTRVSIVDPLAKNAENNFEKRDIVCILQSHTHAPFAACFRRLVVYNIIIQQRD